MRATLLRILLGLGALGLVAVGVLLVVAGASIEDDVAATAIYTGVGVILLVAAALGARRLLRGEIRAAGWVLGLGVTGTLMALLGAFYGFAEAVCEGGEDCSYASHTVIGILIIGGLGIVAVAVAVGLRRVK